MNNAAINPNGPAQIGPVGSTVTRSCFGYAARSHTFEDVIDAAAAIEVALHELRPAPKRRAGSPGGGDGNLGHMRFAVGVDYGVSSAGNSQ